ncbi:alpha/beta fold hydrolase [Umezawaea tangerina]|uniref:Pimeloyl-ACP methyl ester carboxylesterase n=1 Tax=Umezawaea tangerina TaxID=84725 RepID=A0A2T0TH88_9PSEU|nr:alpha/beta hydrolase [Umezawaea tangerina]PRY44978.1 pimeloyl-ACP methyl ester carboxylesterase [Umezawaea tangerina]
MAHDVTGVPHLPAGFTDRFRSEYVPVDGTTVHAVVGGDGPPLLLLPGWPQFWYGWRLLMPDLAEHFTVIAADLRGQGASDKPATGYDAATLASDMAGLMAALGHEHYAIAGYDVGMMVAYVLAADHPDRVTRLAVAEAILPGVSPSPPLLMDPAANEYLWHFAFNRLADINDRMVAGREEVYFGHQFASKAATPTSIPREAVDVYVDVLRDPAARHASFEYYRDQHSTPQILDRQRTRLPMPVLAIGAERASGASVEQTMRAVATDVTGLVIPGSGHYVPEEAPDALLEALLDFFSQGRSAD